MKVYISELGRTATLFLYDLDEKECAEQFVLKKLELTEGGIMRLTDEMKQEIPHGIDLSGVKYAISEEAYKDLIPVLEAVQQAYDKTKDEMIDAGWSMDEALDYVKKAGEVNDFYCG